MPLAGMSPRYHGAPAHDIIIGRSPGSGLILGGSYAWRALATVRPYRQAIRLGTARGHRFAPCIADIWPARPARLIAKQ